MFSCFPHPAQTRNWNRRPYRFFARSPFNVVSPPLSPFRIPFSFQRRPTVVAARARERLTAGLHRVSVHRLGLSFFLPPKTFPLPFPPHGLRRVDRPSVLRGCFRKARLPPPWSFFFPFPFSQVFFLAGGVVFSNFDGFLDSLSSLPSRPEIVFFPPPLNSHVSLPSRGEDFLLTRWAISPTFKHFPYG